jgi:D-glycero-D-manno-heptose 1,7-bisphosphate phosphatase
VASARAVFLDRDGVVNDLVERDGRPVSPRRLADFVVSKGVADATARLRKGGWRVVVVTNQPDVARGALSTEILDEMHRVLRDAISFDALYACVHDDRDGCSCRKPLPGMLEQAAHDLDLDLAGSWMIGDRWVDIAAASAAGCRSILLERPDSWDVTTAGAPPAHLEPTRTVASLGEAVDIVLSE